MRNYYDYGMLQMDLERLLCGKPHNFCSNRDGKRGSKPCDSHNEIRYYEIGKTVLGLPIPCIVKGIGEPQILIFGGIHAREWISSALVMRLLDAYDGEAAVAFVPMVNIDGVQLAIYGENAEFGDKKAEKALKKRIENLKKINGGSDDFSLWKANIRGVDLNVNFPADWGSGEKNVFEAATENFVGPCPASEPETVALMNVAKNVKVALCFHSKGEVIYYGYKNACEKPKFDNEKQRIWAEKFAQASGYELQTSEGSAGGFKDWFVKEGKGFSATIELGDDDLPHPINLGELEKIYLQNKDAVQIAVKILREIESCSQNHEG